MKEEIFIKENNGGVSIEYYQDDTIVAVICGLQYYTWPDPYDDLTGLLTGRWDYTDSESWYDENGNYWGNKNREGQKVTAADVMDKSDFTQVIAYAVSYDGEIKKIEIYPDKMGHTGKKYFKLEPIS